LGDVDSSDDMDAVSLRYANPANAQIELGLSEEQSTDTETGHVLEDVGVFVGE
jgi:UDP-glucose 4-epimerase